MTDVAPGASLLDWVTGLVTDPSTQARFAADPHQMLGEAGLADLDPADLHHAIPLVTDSVAARLDAVVDTSTPIPGLLAGESGLEAAVRQFTAISDRIVPDHLDHHDHLDVGHDVIDLDAPAGPHDVPAGFDDAPGPQHHDLREIHDLDDRAHDAWSAHQPADTTADHVRPVPAFATGHGSPVGGVDPDHADDAEHTDHAEPPDGPHEFVHGAPDEGDHHLDEGARHHLDHPDHTDHPDHPDHPDHTDSHHDPGAALGAS